MVGIIDRLGIHLEIVSSHFFGEIHLFGTTRIYLTIASVSCFFSQWNPCSSTDDVDREGSGLHPLLQEDLTRPAHTLHFRCADYLGTAAL
jgi:hypothetical protein